MSGGLDRRALLRAAGSIAIASAALGRAAAAAAPEQRILLWASGAPEPVPPGLQQHFVERSTDPAVVDRALQGITAPFLEHYPAAARSTGAAVVLCPGGGYRRMAWDKEGVDLARWFAERGVTAFILAYRLPAEGWASGLDAPLADAQRALRLLRQRAGTLGIDAARIAVMGFSAGGHLVTYLATAWAKAAYPAQDAADAQPCRPALVAALYPAIRLEDFEPAMFGPQVTPRMLADCSPHRRVPDDAPPHFLLHAEDDPLVGADHTLALRSALLAKKVRVETHLQAQGGHGFGLRGMRGLPAADWPERFMAFGRSTGWLPS